MKAALALLLAASPAYACDWQVSREISPMTDKPMCMVRSESAKVTFYKNGTDRPNVMTRSAYVHSGDGLQIRVDDNPAIWMGNNAYQRQKALDQLLPQLEGGQRIRTQYRDMPGQQNGDAPICTLPELLASC